MHLLDVDLTKIQRRNRAAFVAADVGAAGQPGVAAGGAAGVAAGLRTGEKVVLRDQEGEFFAGTVVGLVPEPIPRWHVHIGVRLPEDYAILRLARDRAVDDLLADTDGASDGMGDGADGGANGGADRGADGGEDGGEGEQAGIADGTEMYGPAMFDDMQRMLDLLGEAREAREARARSTARATAPTPHREHATQAACEAAVTDTDVPLVPPQR